MAKVFVSHKKEDTDLAEGIASRIRNNGLNVYLDSIDNHLVQDGPDLGDYIRARLGECTQLMAVVTPKTKSSWWVPWEIGVATEKERFLASFVSNKTDIPTFLEKWPYLRNSEDIDKYCRVSQESERYLREQVARGTSRPGARTKSFASFHRTLKSRLGQTP